MDIFHLEHFNLGLVSFPQIRDYFKLFKKAYRISTDP